MGKIEKKDELSHLVGSKEKRKLRETQKSRRSVLSGLGMFGLVGWSVVVPTLLGAFLGVWLDKHFPGKQSWTLTFLLIGLILGCVTAWHWLSREDKEIHKDGEDNHE